MNVAGSHRQQAAVRTEDRRRNRLGKGRDVAGDLESRIHRSDALIRRGSNRVELAAVGQSEDVVSARTGLKTSNGGERRGGKDLYGLGAGGCPRRNE